MAEKVISEINIIYDINGYKNIKFILFINEIISYIYSIT